MLKRTFDVAASLVGLVVLSPVMIVLVLAVRLTSQGPAVFSQIRVGRHGVPFQCHKLRTMQAGTPHLPTHEAAASFRWGVSCAAPSWTNCRSSTTCWRER